MKNRDFLEQQVLKQDLNLIENIEQELIAGISKGVLYVDIKANSGQYGRIREEIILSGFLNVEYLSSKQLIRIKL